MQVSASTYSFDKCFQEGTIDVAECIRACGRMGLDAVEINDGYVARDNITPAQIKDLAADCGLAVSAFASETNVYQPTLSGVQKEVEGGLKWGEMCNDIGAPVWRVNTAPPGYGMHQVTEEGATEAQILELAIPGFRTLADAGRDWGLQLVMENHYGLTRSSEDTLEFIRRVGAENMFVNLDTGNFWDDCVSLRDMLLAGGSIDEVPLIEDPYEGIERLLPRTTYTHCKIYRLTSDNTNDEVLDYERILRMFVRAGFDGVLSIENFTLDDPMEIVPRAAEMLRRQITKLDSS